MSKAGQRILQGAREALSIAKRKETYNLVDWRRDITLSTIERCARAMEKYKGFSPDERRIAATQIRKLKRSMPR